MINTSSAQLWDLIDKAPKNDPHLKQFYSTSENIDIDYIKDNRSILYMALFRQQTELAADMIKNYPQANFTQKPPQEGRSMIFLAIACELIDVATAILKSGQDIDVTIGPKNASAYWMMCQKQLTPLISLVHDLFPKKLPINVSPDPYPGHTPLWSATVTGVHDITMKMFNIDPDVNLEAAPKNQHAALYNVFHSDKADPERQNVIATFIFLGAKLPKNLEQMYVNEYSITKSLIKSYCLSNELFDYYPHLMNFSKDLVDKKIKALLKSD